ncbi:hypothetical protein X801_04943, partial [Opisthorchis viverrini]
VCWYCKLLADSNALWYLQCKLKNWELPNLLPNDELPPGFWKRYYLERSHFNRKKNLLSPSSAVITNTTISQMSHESTRTTYLTVPEAGKSPMNPVPVGHITSYERRRLVSPTVAKPSVKVERQWRPFSKGQPDSHERMERALWLGQVRRRYSFKELNRRAKSGNVTPCPHRKGLYSPIEPRTKCFAEVFANTCTSGSYSPLRGAVWPPGTEDGFVELTKESPANTTQCKPGNFTSTLVYLGDGDPRTSLLSELVTSYSGGDIHSVTELAHVTVSTGWERESAMGLLETVQLGPPIICRTLLSANTRPSVSGLLNHTCSKMSYIPVSSQSDLDNPATPNATYVTENLEHEQLELLTSPSICDRSLSR